MNAETLYEIAHNEKYTRDERIEQMRGILGETVKLKKLAINGVKYDNAIYNRKNQIVSIAGNQEDYENLYADMKSDNEVTMTKVFPGELICNSVGRITRMNATDIASTKDRIDIEIEFRETKKWEGFM